MQTGSAVVDSDTEPEEATPTTVEVMSVIVDVK